MSGANQSMQALEHRVEAAFKRIMPSGLNSVAQDAWKARSGRAIVRRFKAMKARCLFLKSMRPTVVAARITGCNEAVLARVALCLCNGKGKGMRAGSYAIARDDSMDFGPPFSHEAASQWMEGNGVLFDASAAAVSRSDESDDVREGDAASNGSDASENASGYVSPPVSCPEEAKRSRPMGTKLAERRKVEEASASRLTSAVSSIAHSQEKRLAETRKRNNIALMLISEVPPEMRKEFIRSMAAELMEGMFPSTACDANDAQGVESDAHATKGTVVAPETQLETQCPDSVPDDLPCLISENPSEK